MPRDGLPAPTTAAAALQPAVPAQVNGSAWAGEVASPVQTTVRTPVDVPGFVPAFSARIAVLVREGVDLARVHLNPAEMGPVAVQVTREGQQVRVDLVAEQAGTRAVLEQALPSLAGALREAGFTLSGGGVFQGSGSQGQSGDLFSNPGAGQGGPNGQGEGRQPTQTRGQTGPDDPAPSGLATGRLREPVGLVDEFA